jgi:hypothetical protein
MRFSGIFAFAAFLNLAFFDAAHGYYPLNCNDEHAQDDFKESDLVIIGRVTKTEQYKTKLSDRTEEDYVFYVATVTVGECLKGTAKKGDGVLFDMGGYVDRKGDDTRPTYLRTCNTHGAWGLKPDGVYLLFLAKSSWDIDKPVYSHRGRNWKEVNFEKKRVFEPHSCHRSIHEIYEHRTTAPGPQVAGMKTLTITTTLHVRLYLPSQAEGPELSEFLEWRRKGLSLAEQLEPKAKSQGEEEHDEAHD